MLRIMRRIVLISQNGDIPRRLVLDAGPIILQAAVPVLAHDTVESLAARVLRQEHKVYPQAVRWFLDGKLSIRDGRVQVKGNDAQLLYSDSP